MRKLLNILDQNQLANLCRVLSFSLSDLESVEERSTCKYHILSFMLSFIFLTFGEKWKINYHYLHCK